MLSKAPRDTVVICQPNDSTLAHMGELSSETLVEEMSAGLLREIRALDVVHVLGRRELAACLRDPREWPRGARILRAKIDAGPQ